LITFGIPEALTHYVAAKSGEQKTYLKHALQMSLLGSIVGVLIIQIFAFWLSGSDEQNATYLKIASLTLVPTSLVTVLRAHSAGLGNWGLIAFEKLLGALSITIGITVLALFSFVSILNAVVLIACGPIIGGFVYIPFLFRGGREKPQRFLRKQVNTFALKFWPGVIGGAFLMRLDQSILLPLSNSFEVGIYFVAVSISEAPLLINRSIRDTIYTLDSKSHSIERLRKASSISGVLTLAAALVLGILSYHFIDEVFGAEFREALPVLFILLIASVLGNPGSIAGMILSSRGRPELRSRSLILGAVFNVVLLLLLAPNYGAVGAAVATLIGNIVVASINVWSLKSRFNISDPISPLTFISWKITFRVLREMLRKAL
jgi:O-antigen/teichoic acid export membrane protein